MPEHRFLPLATSALRPLAVLAVALICLLCATGGAFAQSDEPVDPDAYRRQRDEWLAEQARQQAERDKELEGSEEVPPEEWVAVGFRFGWANSDGTNGITAGLTGNFWVGEAGQDYRMGIRPEFHYAAYRGIGSNLVTARNTNFHDYMLLVNFYVEKNMPNEGLGGMFAPFFFVGPGYEMFDGSGVSFSQGFLFDVGAGIRAGHPQAPLVFEAAYGRGFGDLKANNIRVSIGLDWGFE